MKLNVVTHPEQATHSPYTPEPGPRRSAALIVVSAAGVVALIAVAVVIVIMIVTANSSVGEPTPGGTAGAGPAPAAVPTPSVRPSARRYAAPADLQQAMESNGILCSGLSNVTGMPSLGISDAHCSNEDGTEVILRVYANTAEARSNATMLSRGVPGTHLAVGVLVGDNWTVSCSDRTWLTRAGAYLGGQVLRVE
jgi:hypothetical protein